MTTHHLYVHVPFCRLVCAYCDFVTVGGRGDAIPRYVEALLTEMAMRPAPGELDTIYFGGGTPSLLPADAVARVVEGAVDRWRRSPVEVTLEANPSSRETPNWGALRAAGVNRISLGVQSLDDADLVQLARGHTAAEARSAFAAARGAGFENINMDLIYAIPGQTLDTWAEVLRRAVELGPDHLSLYALQLALAPDEWAAPPRAGALRWRRRLAARQDDELATGQYRAAEAVLAGAGYRHYELSSWARPGFEARHNAAYWSRRPYTGIGAGAHSYDGATLRSWNTRNLDEYLASVERAAPSVAGSERLDLATRRFEAVALGLRRVDGIDRIAYLREFGRDPVDTHPEAAQRAVAGGLLEIDERAMRLTAEGRLLANEVLIGFLPDHAASAPEPDDAALTWVGSDRYHRVPIG